MGILFGKHYILLLLNAILVFSFLIGGNFYYTTVPCALPFQFAEKLNEMIIIFLVQFEESWPVAFMLIKMM